MKAQASVAVAHLLALISLTAPGHAARAALIAYEPFAYATNTTLSGQSGGTGWIGAWTNSPLISSHGMISASNLTFPNLNLLTSSSRLRTAAPNGIDNRDFRKLDTTNVAVAAWIDAAGKFGKDGTTLWIVFLARLSVGANSGNGGIHLYDGLGNLAISADGDKANPERVFMGDRASGVNWFFGRTCGGCPCAQLSESSVVVNGTTHLFAYRYDFTNNAVDLHMFIDPLPGLTPATASAAVTLTNLCAFDFDWVEMGSGDESLDLDELRIATSFAEAAPVVPALLAITTSDSTAQLHISGQTTQAYVVEATGDFINWINLGNSRTATNGVARFDDTNSPTIPQRFYRLRWP